MAPTTLWSYTSPNGVRMVVREERGAVAGLFRAGAAKQPQPKKVKS